MHVQKRVLAPAQGFATHQGVIPATGALANVHDAFDKRHFAQNRVVMGGLVGIAPPQRLDAAAIGFIQPDNRLVQRLAGDIGTGFARGALDDVAPNARPIDIAEHPFDEQRFDMVKLLRQRAQFILDQAALQVAHPGHIDQRLWQVFIHLAIPFGQQLQGDLALALGRALGGRGAGEPQLGANQRQQAARCGRYRIQLRLDKTVAGVHLARLHQALPALHALAVAPVKGHMQGKGALDRFVIRIAQDPADGVHEFGVGAGGKQPLPAVLRQPAGGRHAALGLVGGIAAGHGANGAHGNLHPIHHRQVLRGRNIKRAAL